MFPNECCATEQACRCGLTEPFTAPRIIIYEALTESDLRQIDEELIEFQNAEASAR